MSHCRDPENISMPPNEDSDNESIEDNAFKDPAADWGKAKYDYYYTDYIDKDYPNTLTVKEERLARLEQEEAIRIQKKLLSTLDNVNYDITIDDEADQDTSVLDFIENQNRSILAAKDKSRNVSDERGQSKRKRVKFDSEQQLFGSDECAFSSNEDDGGTSDDNSHHEDEKALEQTSQKRRPINIAIQKNRGLTPYKRKDYRNPRVKHRLKYKKALSKRRHIVKEAQSQYHLYSGEATGIKTSTIKSIRLC